MVLFAPPANDTQQDLAFKELVIRNWRVMRSIGLEWNKPATFMVAQSMGDFAS
jgi:hypothetical protein